jgi:hypothetical protein
MGFIISFASTGYRWGMGEVMIDLKESLHLPWLVSCRVVSLLSDW